MAALLKPSPARRITIDMTPMIDIVFQLLIFFVMTLRLAEPEGDLQMRLPKLAAAGPEQLGDLPPLTLVLRAADDGSCSEVVLHGRSFRGTSRWDDLHRHLTKLVGEGEGRADVQMRIVCDERLHYEHTIDAITAASGSLDASGRLQPLIERIQLIPAGQ